MAIYYNLAATNTSASIVVNDNDNFIISITESEDIREGDDAVFVISSAQVPTENLVVMVDIDSTGDFFSARFTDFTTISANHDSTELRIQTIDDEIYESNGNISVSIVSDFGYRVDDKKIQCDTENY